MPKLLDENGKRQLLTALADFKQEKYEKCTAALNAFLAEYSNLGVAWKLLGMCQLKLSLDAEHSFSEAMLRGSGDHEVLNNLAYINNQKNNFEQGKYFAQQALDIMPDFNQAYCNLGNACRALKDDNSAVANYRRALELDDGYLDARINLIELLQSQGMAQEASVELDKLKVHRGLDDTMLLRLAWLYINGHRYISAREMLDTVPDERKTAKVMRGISKTYCKKEELDLALSWLKKASEIEKDSADLENDIGLVYAAMGKNKQSMSHFNRSIKLDRKLPDAYANLGMVYAATSDCKKSIENCHKALRINKNLSQCYNTIANVLVVKNKRKWGKQAYRKAISIPGDSYVPILNLALLLCAEGSYEEGFDLLMKSLHHRERPVEALHQLGNIEVECGRMPEAYEFYKRCIELDPRYAPAYGAVGTYLTAMGKLEEGEAHMQKAIALNPDLLELFSPLLYFYNLDKDTPEAKAFEVAKEYGSLMTKRFGKKYVSKENLKEKIVVGFVSGDIRTHPVGYFIENVLNEFNRKYNSEFEIIVYHNHFHYDKITYSVKSKCAHWRDINGVSDYSVYEMIKDDGVDILIDLSGHTDKNRLSLFAARPAKIQATWLGYFATTGLSEIDYVLTDPVSSPPSDQRFFTEKFAYLKNTRLCFTPPVDVVEVIEPPSRTNGYITFGCFQNISKINAEVLEAWGLIMQALPSSRLLLKARHLDVPDNIERFRKFFAARGIDEYRVTIEPDEDRLVYLNTYNRIDICLDTFPFPGGTTTAEALWMATPILTMKGYNMVSRQGELFMNSVHLGDWVADNVSEYVTKAIRFSRDFSMIQNIKGSLRAIALKSPVFDSERFADDLMVLLTSLVNKRSVLQ